MLRELKQKSSSATRPESQPTTAEGLPQLGQNASDDQPLSPPIWEKACDCPPADGEREPETSWPLEAVPQTLWCNHIGLLLLAPVVDPPQALLKQWLASLGALNIEQTKFRF